MKHFDKHGTFEKVIEGLKNNKIFKDRVPENYLEAVNRVKALFFYQTVYDSRSRSLTSLEPIPENVANDIESEFLGDRSVIESKEGNLYHFVNGYLDKKSFTVRPHYANVLDLKRFLADYHSNSVNEYSFVCVDRSFFATGFSLVDSRIT